MKLHAEQLAHSLSKKIGHLYLISGEETLLVEEAIKQIRKAIMASKQAERETYWVDRSFNWGKWLTATHTDSLFAEYALIELHIPNNFTLQDHAKKLLLEYALHPASNKTLLIIHYFDYKKQKTPWFKKLEANSLFLPLWTVTAKQLPYWIQNRLRSHLLNIDQKAIALIVEYTEGNLLATHQALEKLRLYYGQNRKLSYQDVAMVISDHAQYNIFELANMALLGDSQKTLRILTRLKGDGTEPTLILWSLTREIRTLLNLTSDKKNNRSFEKSAATPTIRATQKPHFQAAYKRHTPETLFPLLKKAAFIDRCIKGLERETDLWLSFEELCLAICSVTERIPSFSQSS
jgi:DNA polymerase-3 subunit delta